MDFKDNFKKFLEEKKDVFDFKYYLNNFFNLILDKELFLTSINDLDNLEVDIEIKREIETYLVTFTNQVHFMRFFLRLFSFYKIKISNQNLEKLKNLALISELDSYIVLDLCNYVYSIKDENSCDFYFNILNNFIDEKNHLAGEILFLAAKSNCINCKTYVDKILSSEDKNPVAIDFANLASEEYNK